MAPARPERPDLRPGRARRVTCGTPAAHTREPGHQSLLPPLSCALHSDHAVEEEHRG